MITRPLQSRRTAVRCAWLAGALGATGLVSSAAARLSRFPPGYNGKQSEAASRLVQRPREWEALRRGTAGDLFVFIPVYGAWGLLLAAVVGAARSTAEKPVRLLRAAVVGMAGADVIETVLFRETLAQLLDTHGAAPIGGRVRVTQAFTAVKWTSFAAVMGLLVYEVVRAPVPWLASGRHG